MSPIDGYPAADVAKARKAAGELMAKFDANKDGFITRSEFERDAGISTDVFRDRINDQFVWQTVVTRQNYQHLHDVAALDANKDGKVSVEEVTEKAVLDMDSNKDGKLSWSEKFFSSWSGRVWDNVKNRSVELARKTTMVYDPLPVQPPPMPVPPKIEGDRPAPPSIDTDRDRPRPPSSGQSSLPPRNRPPSL